MEMTKRSDMPIGHTDCPKVCAKWSREIDASVAQRKQDRKQYERDKMPAMTGTKG